MVEQVEYKHPFHYFDQFLDVEVDLKPYQNYMLKFDKKFQFSNWQPLKTKLKNLFYQHQIINNYARNKTFFIRYQVKDYETMEYVAYKFYEDVEFWWVIAVFNNIKNPFNDWILTNEQLQMIALWLTEKEGKYPYEVYYKLLFERNEEKRNIIILRPEELNNLVWEFIQKIRETQVQDSIFED